MTGPAAAGPGCGPIGVERVAQTERLEDHCRERLLVVDAGSRLDNEACEDVVGVGIEPSRAWRKMLAISRIDEADQVLRAELMMDVGGLDLSDLDRLRIVGDVAHHVEQRTDGHVLPCRILRQPAPDRVVEPQLAIRLQLQNQRRSEFLGVAADVEQGVRADRLRIAEPIGARENGDDRVVRAAIHLQCGARKPLDRPALRDIGVNDLLHLGGDRHVIGSRGHRTE